MHDPKKWKPVFADKRFFVCPGDYAQMKAWACSIFSPPRWNRL